MEYTVYYMYTPYIVLNFSIRIQTAVDSTPPISNLPKHVTDPRTHTMVLCYSCTAVPIFYVRSNHKCKMINVPD
jgi:hypothetical protein